MCGFKWVLTNHGIAEWAVGWRAKSVINLTGAPSSGEFPRFKEGTGLTVLLSLRSFSITSISCSFWSGSKLKAAEERTRKQAVSRRKAIIPKGSSKLDHIIATKNYRLQSPNFSSHVNVLKYMNIWNIRLKTELKISNIWIFYMNIRPLKTVFFLFSLFTNLSRELLLSTHVTLRVKLRYSFKKKKRVKLWSKQTTNETTYLFAVVNQEGKNQQSDQEYVWDFLSCVLWAAFVV